VYFTLLYADSGVNYADKMFYNIGLHLKNVVVCCFSFQVELTEKGLKKFDHSIEVSYSNIQRLVLTYLNTVSQSLNFHLVAIL
jgi:hypothetical protein